MRPLLLNQFARVIGFEARNSAAKEVIATSVFGRSIISAPSRNFGYLKKIEPQIIKTQTADFFLRELTADSSLQEVAMKVDNYNFPLGNKLAGKLSAKFEKYLKSEDRDLLSAIYDYEKIGFYIYSIQITFRVLLSFHQLFHNLI